MSLHEPFTIAQPQPRAAASAVSLLVRSKMRGSPAPECRCRLSSTAISSSGPRVGQADGHRTAVGSELDGIAGQG